MLFLCNAQMITIECIEKKYAIVVLGDVQIPLPRGNNRYLHLVGGNGDDGDIPLLRLESCFVVCLGKGCDCFYTSKCDGPCNNCITSDFITCDCITSDCITFDCNMMWEHELVECNITRNICFDNDTCGIIPSRCCDGNWTLTGSYISNACERVWDEMAWQLFYCKGSFSGKYKISIKLNNIINTENIGDVTSTLVLDVTQVHHQERLLVF